MIRNIDNILSQVSKLSKADQSILLKKMSVLIDKKGFEISMIPERIGNNKFASAYILEIKNNWYSISCRY